MRRVLVCGGRDFNDVDRVRRGLLPFGRNIVIIHGDARGADALAGSFARSEGIAEIKVPAQWAYYGKIAGPIRNKWMLEGLKPDIVVAFPGGRGTADMRDRAEKAGIQVIRP